MERLVSLAEDIKALAVAQDRTDQQIQELILAQRRTDERLASLAEDIKALAIAQRRTDERLESFEKVQQRLVTAIVCPTITNFLLLSLGRGKIILFGSQAKNTALPDSDEE